MVASIIIEKFIAYLRCYTIHKSKRERDSNEHRHTKRPSDWLKQKQTIKTCVNHSERTTAPTNRFLKQTGTHVPNYPFTYTRCLGRTQSVNGNISRVLKL